MPSEFTSENFTVVPILHPPVAEGQQERASWRKYMTPITVLEDLPHYLNIDLPYPEESGRSRIGRAVARKSLKLQLPYDQHEADMIDAIEEGATDRSIGLSGLHVHDSDISLYITGGHQRDRWRSREVGQFVERAIAGLLLSKLTQTEGVKFIPTDSIFVRGRRGRIIERDK
jgi:hypothetical protein